MNSLEQRLGDRDRTQDSVGDQVAKVSKLFSAEVMGVLKQHNDSLNKHDPADEAQRINLAAMRSIAKRAAAQMRRNDFRRRYDEAWRSTHG
jgi:hypothetical protein